MRMASSAISSFKSSVISGERITYFYQHDPRRSYVSSLSTCNSYLNLPRRPADRMFSSDKLRRPTRQRQASSLHALINV